MIPYKEKIIDEIKIRTFSSDVDENELKWHQDHEDRLIILLEETDWLIQKENELPENINKYSFIKKNEWHRVIKGKKNLKVLIYTNIK